MRSLGPCVLGQCCPASERTSLDGPWRRLQASLCNALFQFPGCAGQVGQAGIQGVQNVQQWPPVLGTRGGRGCGWQETPRRGGFSKARLHSGFSCETQHILREMCLGTGVCSSSSCSEPRVSSGISWRVCAHAWCSPPPARALTFPTSVLAILLLCFISSILMCGPWTIYHSTLRQPVTNANPECKERAAWPASSREGRGAVAAAEPSLTSLAMTRSPGIPGKGPGGSSICRVINSGRETDQGDSGRQRVS